jgi:microcompartment protein CcmL/EutN
MLTMSLGTIEVFGLPAAIQAADVACKAADVHLIGYETTDGMGMVAVKIEGQVAAVQSAVAAACAAAAQITKVFATSVIPRPSNQLDPVVLTKVTVGLERDVPAAPEKPAAEAPVEEPAAPEPEVAKPEAEAVSADVAPAPEPAAEAAPEPAPADSGDTPPAKPAQARTRTTKK